MFYGSWVYVGKMYDIGILAQDLPIPQWVPRLVLPIGFALLILRFAQCSSASSRGKESRLHLADEAADALKLRQDGSAGRGAGERQVMTTAILFVMLFAFMLIGMPIAIALGLSSVLTILFFGQDSLPSLALKLFETSEHFTLLAIPFFILSGAFMTTGGVAKRMIRFAIACIGHLRGGLAMASVLACMLFAAVSGSSPATVVAVGSIVIAGMVKAGYSQKFAAGVICNAGTLGILIPPSIVMVVYGAATETSVGKLFMAGVIPGILLGLMLMVAIYVRARMLKLPRQPRASHGRGSEGGPRFDLGPAAARHHPGRDLRRHLHADRGGGGRGGLRLLRRRVRLSGHRHEEGAARAGRCGAGDGDADVHRRQRAAVRARAHDRAHPAGDRRADRLLGHGALAVPDRGEHPAADRGQLHGADGDHPDPGADPLPDRRRSSASTRFTSASSWW